VELRGEGDRHIRLVEILDVEGRAGRADEARRGRAFTTLPIFAPTTANWSS
jgi:hypothetical protein